MDSASYAAEVRAASGKECLVYKCVNDAQFSVDKKSAMPCRATGASIWSEAVDRRPGEGADHERGHGTGEEVRRVVCCVCIPGASYGRVRATRGKAAPGEHLNMLRKQQASAEPCGINQ